MIRNTYTVHHAHTHAQHTHTYAYTYTCIHTRVHTFTRTSIRTVRVALIINTLKDYSGIRIIHSFMKSFIK